MSFENSGVSWRDVSCALNSVSKAHSCRIHITMGLPIRLDVGKVWDIRIAALRGAPGGGWHEFLGRSCAWPSTDHTTMTGLMLWLVYELERGLEEQARRELLALRAPRLPGFE